MPTRREVLALMGGLPFTRPDQHYEPPPGGLVPGSRSGILIAKKVVIISGAGGGLFVYSPTVAPQNLVAAIVPVNGTDGHTNAVLAGIVGYQAGSAGAVGSTQMIGGNLSFYTAPSEAGPYTLQASIGGAAIAGTLQLFGLPGGQVQVPSQLFNAGAGAQVTGGTTTDTLVASNASSASPVVSITNTTSAPTNDTLRVNPAGSADKAIGVRVTGESNDRFLVQTNATPGATLFFGPGTSGADISLLRAAANQLNLHTADLDIDSAGRGLRVAEGSNAKQGTATLVAGTVTVANTSVTANSRIFVGQATPGGTVGAPFVSSVTAGTGFTIKSTSATDTSKVCYEIFEPG